MGLLEAGERSITRGLTLTSDASARLPLLNLREQGKRLRERQAARREFSAAESEAERKAGMCFTHLLTPDILYLVAGAGTRDDPDFALRMAGVCGDWRAVVLGQSSLWSHLRLGRRRPVSKAALWIDRSRGRLKIVEVGEHVPAAEHQSLAAILAPVAHRVERAHFVLLTVSHYIDAWKGKCRALRTLKIHSDYRLSLFSMLGILHPDARPEVVEMTSTPAPAQQPQHSFARHAQFDLPAGSPVSLSQLAQLKTLRFGSVSIHSQEPWVLQLAQAALKLQTLELRGLSYTLAAVQEEPVSLEHLTRLEVCDRTGLLAPTTTLVTPNLTHYGAYNWHPRLLPGPGPILNILDNIRGLPRTLTSLDIGRTAFVQSDLIALLREFENLRFLNVSFCGIDNDFLEALATGGLLPSLTALSVAGHDTLSSGPLRRLVLHRLGIAPKKKTAPLSRRSAFAPTRKAPSPSEKAKAEAEAKATEKEEEEAKKNLVPITWICVDQCNHYDMNVDILLSLRKHVRFLSSHNGQVVEDRIRGRGAYAWDADDFGAACMGNGEGGCQLRKRRADEDGWYVHHTCKLAKLEAEQSMH